VNGLAATVPRFAWRLSGSYRCGRRFLSRKTATVSPDCDVPTNISADDLALKLKDLLGLGV
jgi:hypothetical protein